MTDRTDHQPRARDAGDDHDGLDSLGYEQARDELVEVVRRLEAGGTSLEEALALWERGEHLASVCQRQLDAARARLAEVTGEGNPSGADGDEDPAPTAG